MIIEGALSYGGAPSLRERLLGPPAAPSSAPPREQRGAWVDHPDVRVGRTLVPNAEHVVGGVTVRSDALGLRRLGRTAKPGGAVFRVALIGGDEVFGLGREDADTLVVAVEEAWERASPPAPLVLTPVALPSWSLRNAVALLGDHLDELAPDAVVVLPGGAELSDTVGAGRDGVLGVQRDPLSELPWMRVDRARLFAALDELAASRGWTRAARGVWWFETGRSPLSSRRLDDVARLVARVAQRSGAPWLLLDDERGVLGRVHARLRPEAPAVGLARLDREPIDVDLLLDALVRLAPDAEPVPDASVDVPLLATLSPVVDLTDGRGALQIHGGLHGDGAIDPTFAVVLRRDVGRDRLRLRLRPIPDGPARVVVTATVDGTPVGRAVVDRDAGPVEDLWTCPPVDDVRATDVVLTANAQVVRDDGAALASVEFVSLAFE